MGFFFLFQMITQLELQIKIGTKVSHMQNT